MGRESSTARLRQVFEEAAAGRGRLVLIGGEPGVGKSALAEYVCAHAAGTGATVAWGPCWEGDGVSGFWPWQQIVRAAAGDDRVAGTGLEPLFPDGPSAAPGVDADAMRFRLFTAVAEQLRRAAARAPLVVVLDDLHWADAGAVRLLGFVARQLRRERALLVGTFREAEIGTDHPVGDLMAALPADAEVVSLGGLDCAATGELLRRTLGEVPSVELATAVHRRTGGNPFFITQLTLTPDSPAPMAESLPGSGLPTLVGDVILRRLARLPEPMMEQLSAASALGAEFDDALLSAVVGVGYAESLAQVEAAVRSGVLVPAGVGRHRFTHDLFRESLYGALPAGARSRTHQAIATALQQRSAAGGAVTPGELAHHFTLAVPEIDPRVAARFAIDAAEDACTRLAYEEAARHWRQALRLLEQSGNVPLPVRLNAAEALLCAGERTAAWTGFADAARQAASVGDALALGTAALGLHRLGADSDPARREVVGLLNQAAAALPAAPGDPALALYARVLAALAREHHGGPRPDPRQATELAYRACATAHASGDKAAMAWCLHARHDVFSGPGTAPQRLAIADEMAVAAAAGNVPDLMFQAYFCRFVAMVELADPRALAAIRELEHLAAELNLPVPRYLVLSRQAALAQLGGRDHDAQRLGEQAARFAELIGESAGAGVHASQRLMAALNRVGWAGATEVQAELGDRAVCPELTPLLHAMAALGTGDRMAAAEILRALPLQTEQSPAGEQTLAGAAFDVELAAATGLAERCAAYYERLLPYARQMVVLGGVVSVLGPVSLYLGQAAVAQQQWDRAIGHLDDALALTERLAARPLTARVRAHLGAALLRRGGPGDRARAQTLLAEAATAADALGLRALHDETVRTLNRDTTVDAAAPPAVPGATAVFRRDGEVWTLRYADRTVQLRDAKGLRDLAALLAVPGQEIPASRLLAGVDAPAQQLGGDEVIDQQARAAYKRRLADLDEQIAEAEDDNDTGRLDRYAAERAALIDELARAYGLGGRVRRLGDTGERARSTVTARIRDALRRIDRTHPELGAHLHASVTTGRACSYRPATPLRWEL
ncbi:AAA ATPase-like protein [Krasilnikovia cinnamomea]|uniref:AAA ATPase-like protein n=1 Tax=Krasilnikovia cinnamomea TaxID=349313 RepID=A0A4Q7ZSZ9_9ACTN|nr:AAA ATPase-like protein [Krasilnikovia cinnamomea]